MAVVTTGNRNVYIRELKRGKKPQSSNLQWQHTPIIPAPERLRHKVGYKFKASLGYIVNIRSAWATKSDNYKMRNTNKQTRKPSCDMLWEVCFPKVMFAKELASHVC